MSKLILFSLPFLVYAESCAENVSSFSCSDMPASFSTLPSARHGIQQECKPEYGAGIFTLDFLFWQAKEEGLEYALSDDLLTGANIQTNINAEVIDADFDWELLSKSDSVTQFNMEVGTFISTTLITTIIRPIPPPSRSQEQKTD